MRQFGLVGRTLQHSFSQTYFTQKFYSQGLADDHRYDLFELAEIEEFPALLRANPALVGLNVTVPYKEAVVPYLDELASSAARVGHNTDVVGFRESLKQFFPGGAGSRALVLGAGGAAKAVVVALNDLGIAHWSVTRNPLGHGLTYDELTPALLAAHPLIINATPLGTYPQVDACPRLLYEALGPQHYLYDLVYNPSETLFMAKGREAGAHTKNGFEMLERQAEAAWDIWNGR